MAHKAVLSFCSDRVENGTVCYILKMDLGKFFLINSINLIHSALDLDAYLHFRTLDVCPSPPKLVHGSHDGNDFSNGRSITYSCDPLYVLEGPEVMTCVNEQWLGQIPVCRGN